MSVNLPTALSLWGRQGRIFEKYGYSLELVTDLFNPFFAKVLTASVCKSDKMDLKNSGQL